MYQLSKKDLASLIKEGRAIKGYTQQQLSERTGISLRSIQRIENEEVLPRSYTISVLAGELDVSGKLTKQEPAAINVPATAPGIKDISGMPDIMPSPQVSIASFRPRKLNKPRRIILSIGIGVLLILGTAAFLAQATRFPETNFECLLLWMTIAGAYMIILLMLWK